LRFDVKDFGEADLRIPSPVRSPADGADALLNFGDGVIRSSVLNEARVVGATAKRTFLRPNEFSTFDTVIIDEASMILLPAVFHSAGLAKERIVVSGDFRQLPPIVQAEQEEIFRVLGHDDFMRAGITNAVEQGTVPPRLVMLQQQYSVTPWFYVTADMQVVTPILGFADTSLVLGARARIDF
jgi:AAA domain